MCGSGLVDAIAELVRVGLLDHSGRFIPDDDARERHPGLAERLTKIGEERVFVLDWRGRSDPERAVFLSQTSELFVPLSELTPPISVDSASAVTLEDAERQHILNALNETKWTISGPTGAAVRLGMKRTTLISKMQKLGISRPR